jgi:hypothetical protein
MGMLIPLTALSRPVAPCTSVTALEMSPMEPNALSAPRPTHSNTVMAAAPNCSWPSCCFTLPQHALMPLEYLVMADTSSSASAPPMIHLAASIAVNQVTSGHTNASSLVTALEAPATVVPSAISVRKLDSSVPMVSPTMCVATVAAYWPTTTPAGPSVAVSMATIGSGSWAAR